MNVFNENAKIFIWEDYCMAIDTELAKRLRSLLLIFLPTLYNLTFFEQNKKPQPHELTNKSQTKKLHKIFHQSNLRALHSVIL